MTHEPDADEGSPTRTSWRRRRAPPVPSRARGSRCRSVSGSRPRHSRPVFIPDHATASSASLVSGIHEAFVALAVLTALSSLLFRTLRSEDGQLVSQHRSELAED